MEDRIPERSNVTIIGRYDPSPIGEGRYRKGVRPVELNIP
jgi:hypothetical protein